MFRLAFVMTIIGAALFHTAYAQPAAPTPSRAVEAKQKQDGAWRQAREAYRQAIIAADQQYVSDLDAALKNAMQALNIDLARTFDDLKKSALAVLQRDQAELDVAGEWRVAAVQTAVVPDGLVGYWSLEGSTINWVTGVVQDVSGQGHDGRLVNMSATTSPVPGTIGGALRFNGTNYVLTSYAGVTGTSARTIAMWVATTQSAPLPGTNASTVIGFGDPVCGGYLLIATNDEYGFHDNQQGITVDNPCIGGITYSAPSLYDGSWHLITVIMPESATTTNVRMYLDGTVLTNVVKNSAVSFRSIGTGSNVVIGTSGFHDGGGFVGFIHGVRIYNRALSAQEVQQLFSSGH